MTAPRQKVESSTIQAQILEQLMEVKGKVEKSLEQGAENGKQIELIKMALGMDGAHGRLPELERAIARVDKNQENDHKEHDRIIEALDKRVEALESADQRSKGLKQFLADARGFIGGSLGAGILGLIAHWCHWIK